MRELEQRHVWRRADVEDALFMLGLLSPWWVGALYFTACMIRLAGGLQ